MVLLYEKKKTFVFFTTCFTHVSFLHSSNTNLNNEHHNLKSKGLENNRLKVSCSPHVEYYPLQCFQCIQLIHYTCIGILTFPCCVNGTYKYIAIGINKHYVQQWMLCNITSNIIINGCSIFGNEILCPSITVFWTHQPWIALTNLCAIHDMMGVCNRFKT
jgi:hypothetical protein